MATLDGDTSPICQELDGQHFPMKSYQVGVTAPPFQPNCRSCTCPYFDDEFSKDNLRVARGEDGKTYHAPADMTYKEWKEKHVDGGLTDSEKDGSIELTKDEEKAIYDYMSSHHCYQLNHSLCEGIPLTNEQEILVKNLDSALDKLPSYQGTVYRSVDAGMMSNIDAFERMHQVGEYVSYPEYTSTGLTVYDNSFTYQFVIESKSGKDITNYNPFEEEILFKRKSEFFVYKTDGNTIYMKEA